MSLFLPPSRSQAEALRAARDRKGWSQTRLSAALEQAARILHLESDLPPGGRKTIIQYISYFENGKRAVPDRLKPLFREVFQATDQDLCFTEIGTPPTSVQFPFSENASLTHIQAFSPEIIDSLRLIRESTVHADARIGPACVIPGILGNISIVEQLCHMTRGSDHEQAILLAANYTEFCGWLYQDSGDYPCAMFWTDRALEYAMELNDHQLVSYILMRKSNIATESGQPGYALGLANAALKQSSALTPRLIAVTLRQRAATYALLNEITDFRQDADDALSLAISGLDQEEPDKARYCSPSYIRMELGASWLKLGLPIPAITLFEDSQAQWSMPEQKRDQALCLARLATAYAASGSLDQASQITEKLLTTANGLHSARVSNQVHDLNTAFSPWRKNTSVTDLAHRLQAFQSPDNQTTLN